MLLNCVNIIKYFGIEPLFEGISFHIEEGQKIGLIGVNGAGKTTLFNILTGESDYDSGEIIKSKGLNIGYFKQYADYGGNDTLWGEMEKSFIYFIELERELNHIQQQLNSTGNPPKGLIERQAEIMEKLVSKNGFSYETRIRAVLLGLGFDEEQFKIPVNSLSGGQKTRLALGKLLMDESNLLLLDEPTNHLDIKSTEWLEDYLINYKSAFIVISHDRYFLDRVTNKTMEIENRKIYSYNGNYSTYISNKDEIRSIQMKHYTEQQKEIKRLEASIELQRSFNREKSIKKAESMEKRLEKMEKIDKPDNLPQKIRFNLKTKRTSGQDVLIAEGLSKAYGSKKLFENLGLHIKKGDKTFILGDNGTGKTTLLKIFNGLEKADKGKFKIGTNVDPAYFDQGHTGLNTENTVIEEVWSIRKDLTLLDVRNALAAMQFKNDDIEKKINVLSGGEKARIAILKLMFSDANFLMLDEPTNHLDINSREVLEDALTNYDGTLLCISHDRYFVNKLADKLYYLDKNSSFTAFDGDYGYMVQKLKDRENTAFEKNKKDNGKVKEKSSYHLEKERLSAIKKMGTKIERIEKSISEKENQITELNNKMLQPEYQSDYEKILDVTGEIEQLQREIDNLFMEWEKINDLWDVKK